MQRLFLRNMKPLHRDFGIEFEGVPAVRELDDALARHSLVCVRAWAATDEELIALGGKLGTIDSAVKRFAGTGPSPDQNWHHVGAIHGKPARATLLYTESAVTGAPGMAFVSMRAAWRTLSPSRQDELSKLTAVHTFRAAPDKTVEQPLVFTDEKSERALFLGYHAVGLRDRDTAAAQTLLAGLLAAATAEDRVYVHCFQPGDLLIWDNRALMHRACALPADTVRVVREIAIH
jgi:alpha-ketoglutarate-dependent taurine dioxygenase